MRVKIRKPWGRLLWGIEFRSGRDSEWTLIGAGWMFSQHQGQPYKGEPTRALLFDTRRQAREWCLLTMRRWAPNHSLDSWQVRPVRVRETVCRIKGGG